LLIKERTLIVYKYTNKINGKIYIGVTTKTLKERHRQHLTSLSDGTYFHKAIKKYGIKSFKLEVIDKTETKEELAKLEQHYIKFYNSFAHNENSNGYNLTLGGEGLTGQYGNLNSQYGVSPLERMGEEKHKEWLNNVKQARKKYSGENHYCYGKHPSEIFGKEKWLKNCELAKERFSSKEFNPSRFAKKGIENPNYGRKYGEEVKKKIRQSRYENGCLGEEKALEIIRLYCETDLTQQEIAEKFNVIRQSVTDVISGSSYGHLNHGYDIKSIMKKKEEYRLKKVSKPIAMVDKNGNIIKEAKSITDMCNLIGWSSAGIIKHLKNRVKNPVFIYL
jgi:group I intron endonuclease